MKKIMCAFLSLLLAVSLLGGCGSSGINEEKDRILTSFYPVYVFTLNLVDGIEDVEVINMTSNHSGCLHDYTLMPKDMKALSSAKAVVINGAGMEHFLEGAEGLRENIIIDSSKGIPLICGEEGESHEGHGHAHGGNAHIWMNPKNAVKQTENIAAGLIKIFPEHRARIEENLNLYKEKLLSLDREISEELKPYKGAEFISFHEAYDYFAEEYSLTFAASVESDDGAEPGTRELVRLTELIKERDVKAIFTEPGYKGSAAGVLSAETGVPVYTLNPMTSGTGEKDSYEKITRENLDTIKKAVNL